MIISRTPFRISFFGGGTDYPAWYLENGGSVLATTIDKYCYLTCRHLPPFFEHRYRIVYAKVESCLTLDQIEHTGARETMRYLGIDRGLEIHHDGDLPARSGLGTSSSFTVGLLNALYALKGQMPSKRQLALESVHIEQDLIGQTVGSQDQFSASYGGFNQISFHTNGEISVKPMVIPRLRTEELNAQLMLFYTGIMRTASDIASGYVQDIKSRYEQLNTIRTMVNDGIDILTTGKPIEDFGHLLHRSWETKRSLSPDISNDSVQLIYNKAMAAGAIGGKLLGAGGGGFMLLFAPPDKQEEVKRELQDLIYVPFKFETDGSQIIFYDEEEDYSSQDLIRSERKVIAFRELSESGISRSRDL